MKIIEKARMKNREKSPQAELKTAPGDTSLMLRSMIRMAITSSVMWRCRLKGTSRKSKVITGQIKMRCVRHSITASNFMELTQQWLRRHCFSSFQNAITKQAITPASRKLKLMTLLTDFSLKNMLCKNLLTFRFMTTFCLRLRDQSSGWILLLSDTTETKFRRLASDLTT